ncbi:hypothetical protein [Steroidobacter sp.]|uniref:hypothetical protein n=1 Tax=Steroidobacter sp. TaxID=1978227 RepID=UPI001A409C81|nr:hypothetical protein [Steroidobacter sp.]MBL8266025.1 hypothetical protein [Steroidobacter sp.]
MSQSLQDQASAYVRVLALGFYDGPESGLVLTESGRGARFVSLGDSRSMLNRAFQLETLEHEWLSKVRALPEYAAGFPSSCVLLPKDSEALRKLDQEIIASAATGCYVAVAAAYLKPMYVAPVTADELAVLRQFAGSPKAFPAVHRFVKSYREKRRSL